MADSKLLAVLADEISSVADHPYVARKRVDYNAGRIGIVELMYACATCAIAEPHLTRFASDPEVARARRQYHSGEISYAEGADVVRRVADKLL